MRQTNKQMKKIWACLKSNRTSYTEPLTDPNREGNYRSGTNSQITRSCSMWLLSFLQGWVDHQRDHQGVPFLMCRGHKKPLRWSWGYILQAVNTWQKWMGKYIRIKEEYFERKPCCFFGVWNWSVTFHPLWAQSHDELKNFIFYK